VSAVKQLPDLARMRVLSDRIRAASDGEVANIIRTDGAFLMADCGRYLDADVARRLATVVAGGMPTGTLEEILFRMHEVPR